MSPKVIALTDVSPSDSRSEAPNAVAGVDDPGHYEPIPVERAEHRLLSFYDRLRQRVHRRLARGGGLGQKAAESLLLVPDLFLLVARLVLDSRTPARTRSLLGGALIYFVTPIDLWPEGLVGPVGYLDDLVLAVAMLESALDARLEPLVDEHWSGSGPARRMLADIAASARLVLGDSLANRLGRVLRRRGVAADQLLDSTATNRDS